MRCRCSKTDRYELDQIPILINDEFWDVGRVSLAEINFVLLGDDDVIRGSR